MSLHQEREKFIQEVQNRLKTDLEENGLVLESVSILTVRAARQGSFGTDAVFGAQVARANAQVITQALRERNDHFDVRIDHSLGPSDDLSFRYSFGDRAFYEPFSVAPLAAIPLK